MSFKAGAIRGEAILDTGKWENGLKKISKGTSNFVKFAAGAFVTGMTIATVQANEFQKEMSNVSTVIDTSVISTQEMTKALLELDPALGGTTELTEGLYQSFSAGADTMDEALQTTVDSAKFAKAALTENSTAVDILTTASNAYGKELVSTSQASDIFFTTIKEGKITGEQLAGSIGQSIPLFASTGVEIEQLASGMAAMTKQGISANESTTQLNAIINSVLKPTEAMSEAIKQYGFDSSSAFLESEGLTGVLKLLEEQTGGNADKISALIPNIRAMKGAMALTGVGGEEYTSVLEEMKNATGATDIAFEKQEKTFETLANQMGKVAIVSGNIGKHFVDDIAGGATEAAGSMLSFITSSQGMEFVANAAGATAATFDLLSSILTPIVTELFAAGKNIFMEVGSELEDLGLVTGEGSAAFDILGTTIEAITTGFRITSASVVGFIDNLGNMIGAIQTSGETIGTFFDFLTGKASWDEVKEQASEAGEAFKTLGLGIVDNFANVAGTIVEEVKTFSTQAESGAREIETSFKASFTNTSEAVTSNWDKMITGQDDFVGDFLANQDVLAEGVNTSTEEIADSNLGLLDTLKEAFTSFREEAEFTWQGLYDTIGSTVSFGVNQIQAIASQGFTNEQAELELWKQNELAILEQSHEDGLLSDEAFQLKKDELDKQAIDKQNASAKKQFELNKVFNIGKVWMDAASSIAGWWGQAPALGPFAGPIFAGTMTAATLGMAGAQTGLISDQQFVPAREKGGMASGMTRINEVGGEIVTLPDGSQVIPNDISRQIAGDINGGSTGNVFKFFDTVISKDMDINRLVNEISRKLARRTKKAV